MEYDCHGFTLVISQNFNKIISRFKRFLANPSLGYFKEKKVTLADLKRKARDRKLGLSEGHGQGKER